MGGAHVSLAMRFFATLLLCLLAGLSAVPVWADERGRGDGRRSRGSESRWHHSGHHRDRHWGHGHRWRPSYAHAPHRHRGWHSSFHYGWAPYRRPFGYGYGYSYPGYGVGIYSDDFSYGRSRAGYATNGLLLGALAGAVIGNNSGDLGNSAWRGAAYGAAGGLVLGAIADHRAAKREAAEFPAPGPATQPAAVAPSETTQSPSTPAPASRALETPMTSANRLFGR